MTKILLSIHSSELSSIDRYWHSNQIKNRSEAIRLLIRRALEQPAPAKPAPRVKYYDECPPCEGMNHTACWHGKPHPNDPAVTVQCGCSCGVLSPPVK